MNSNETRLDAAANGTVYQLDKRRKKPPFKDAVAFPPNAPTMTDVCPRSGVINPVAYNVIEAGKELIEIGIDPGDDLYALFTTEVENNDLVKVKTPDGLFVRFIQWFIDASDNYQAKVRLLSANPESEPLIYYYDDVDARTCWRVVWVCKHGDHDRCSPVRRQGQVTFG